MVQAEPARLAMIILSCRRCGRSVQVFGKVRRVLCACGHVLFEVAATAAGETAPPSGFPGEPRSE